MKLNRSSTVVLTAAALMLAAFSAAAQTARPSFNRAHDFDVQHYTLKVSFDRAAKKVFGDTTVSLKPTRAGFSSVELDAVGLNFETVQLEGTGAKLSYKASATKVIVALDKAYGPADTISIRFKYTTTAPKKGVYFVDEEKGNEGTGHSSQIWSQGEAEEARYWFPSFDFPSDKATTEEYITAEPGETVIGNGVLIDKEDAAGKTTWHYKMPVQHSTYLVSFVIGKYVRIDDKYGDIPLGFYTYPGKENTAKKAFGGTKDMIRVYEELTGVNFPYNKYDQTVVARFQFGGMENITATTMADTEIFLADLDFGEGIVTDLVSHELAHSWFGDLVTCNNWAELWLNEGFATFMEAAYREKAFGRENYITKLRTDAGEFLVDDAINRKRHGLFNRRAGNPDSLFENAAITYNKGGVVVHQLREQVGTANFWKGINAYLNAHKFGNVESTDLRKAMEDASGQDLAWFFDQWVYGVGAPKVTVSPIYNARTQTLRLSITQTQRPDPLAPPAYRMPVNISVETSAGSQAIPVDIKKKSEVVTVRLSGKPSEIRFDPEDKIMLKTVKVTPIQVIK